MVNPSPPETSAKAKKNGTNDAAKVASVAVRVQSVIALGVLEVAKKEIHAEAVAVAVAVAVKIEIVVVVAAAGVEIARTYAGIAVEAAAAAVMVEIAAERVPKSGAQNRTGVNVMTHPEQAIMTVERHRYQILPNVRVMLKALMQMANESAHEKAVGILLRANHLLQPIPKHMLLVLQ